MKQLYAILGGKSVVINEPFFSELKRIVAALNRLHDAQSSTDKQTLTEIQTILSVLLGDDFKKTARI